MEKDSIIELTKEVIIERLIKEKSIELNQKKITLKNVELFFLEEAEIVSQEVLDSKNKQKINLERYIDVLEKEIKNLKEEIKDKKQLINPNRSLRDSEFKYAIGNQFTSFVTGSTLGLGNYASLDTDASSISFGTNYILKNFQAVGFSLEGRSSDGILPVFSNSSLNTNISIGFSYHKVIRNSVDYDIGKYTYYNIFERKKKQEVINKKYKAREVFIENNIESIVDKDYLKRINKKEKEKEEESLIFKDIENVNLAWLSVSAKLRRNSFKLLENPEELNLEEIKDTISTGFEVKAEYSRYYTDHNTVSVKPTFLNLGVALRSTDNFSALTKREFNESTIIEENEETTITNSREFNFYQGNYSNKISELFLFIHYYRYLQNSEKIAFHIYPRLTFTEFQKPLLDFDIGFLFSFKNKKKTKSIINAEVFYSLTDITSKRSLSRDRLLDDSVIGVRFTLPFNINF